MAEGAVLALSLKIGATLLKTPDLPNWDRIAAFAAILALRTTLKRAFAAEQAVLAATIGGGPGGGERTGGPASPAETGRRP